MEITPRPQEDTSIQRDSMVEANSFHDNEPPFEYQILKGHRRPDRKTWKSDEQLRMEYLQLTDGLIQTMTQDMEVINHETGEKEYRPASIVIFLDKSARPLSHLVRDMWPTFARDLETGGVPPMPEFKFLNIDREQWVHKLDAEGSGIIDAKYIDPSVIRSLRSVFLSTSNKDRVRTEGLIEEVDSMSTILDDEAVLLVDETYSTGRTAKIARGMMQRAFPKATIDTAHWMKSISNTSSGNFNDIPVWYDAQSLWGRGVNNRYADFTNSNNLDRSQPENYYRTMGRWFLSAPHWFAYPTRDNTRDDDYHQLIQEFHHLSNDPNIPALPASSRYTSDKAYDDRLIAYNYDVDPSSLDEDEKEAMVQAIISRKKTIDTEAKKHDRP